MGRNLNIAGQEFGWLTALSVDHKHPKQGTFWRCRCRCGTEVIVLRNALSGNTKSCGCLRRELGRSLNRSHGMSDHPYYTIWSKMWQRCTNPDDPKWPRYGARGIRVCARWKDFKQFVADMGPRPTGTTVDREDNDGDYTPGNCRWATAKQQRGNSSQELIRLTHENQTRTLVEWAKLKRMRWATLYWRVVIAKWDVARALTQPVRGYAQK